MNEDQGIDATVNGVGHDDHSGKFLDDTYQLQECITEVNPIKAPRLKKTKNSRMRH